MTEPIAIYGAVTGTIGAAGTMWVIWHQVVRDRPRVRVQVRRGFVQDRPDIKHEWLWFVEVVNRGRRPLSFSGFASFELNRPEGRIFRRRKRVLLVTGSLNPIPARLQEGEKVTYWIYEASLIEGLRAEGRVPRRILITDDAGHSYSRRIDGRALRAIEQLARPPSHRPVVEGSGP